MKIKEHIFEWEYDEDDEDYWGDEEEWIDDFDEEEPECLGMINTAYHELCEVCELRDVCEELAKDEEEGVGE